MIWSWRYRQILDSWYRRTRSWERRLGFTVMFDVDVDEDADGRYRDSVIHTSWEW